MVLGTRGYNYKLTIYFVDEGLRARGLATVVRYFENVSLQQSRVLRLEIKKHLLNVSGGPGRGSLRSLPFASPLKSTFTPWISRRLMRY
jgi:hypothetical protein